MEQFCFMRFDGRLELLFCMQGADLDAIEQSFQPLSPHTTQKKILCTVHWGRRFLTVEKLLLGWWVKTTGLGAGSPTCLLQELRYQYLTTFSSHTGKLCYMEDMQGVENLSLLRSSVLATYNTSMWC